jgi:hypothetical protein
VKRNFIDRFQEESVKSEFWSNTNRKVGIGLASVALLAVILINTTGCTQSNAPEPVLPQEELSKESINFGNDGVNAGIAPDVITGGKDANADKTVAVTVAASGRSDPFLPEMGYIAAGSNESFDIVAPLETITVDPEASRVVATKVSGIMYDRTNPSAILNIEGSDYLVRSGDVLNNYKVLSIGPASVTVQLGANIYKAGVGELFATDGLNYNTISNLESKFGGTRNVVNRK